MAMLQDASKSKNYSLEVIFEKLKKLGFEYSEFPDILYLLDNLVQEVLSLKEQVSGYKTVWKELVKDKFSLKKGLEPYKQDNGRLAMENNELHKKLLNQEKYYLNEVDNLKKKNRELQHEVTDFKFINSKIVERIKELEKEKVGNCESEFLLIENKAPATAKSLAGYEKISNLVKSRENISMGALEKRLGELLEELKEVKLDNLHYGEIIAALKCQVSQKEAEIERLKALLEGGRPISAVNCDYCSQCGQKENRIKFLEKELEEAMEKQHEAMNRALQLAEKNQSLERELKDIDSMALEVEEECENKVKQNLKNMDVLQGRLREKSDEIRKLEGMLDEMKRRIKSDEQELESLRKEKKKLERLLSVATCEKKSLNDKINHFLLVEKNLNAEISRMEEINKSLKRQIGDMEEKVMDILGTRCKPQSRLKQKKHNPVLGLPISKTTSSVRVSVNPSNVKSEDKKEWMEDHCCQASSDISVVGKIREERDFFHSEFHRLKEELGNQSLLVEKNSDLLRQIKEQEKEIASLRQDVFILRRENSALVKRFECSEHLTCSSGDSIKIILDKLEKERDMALSDISRLQGERDALKEKIKLVTESQLGEQSRLERIVLENEERIRRLESERRELISTQSAQRVALASMEEKYDESREQARKAMAEAAQVTANYSQLKILQEQTDRSLSEVQARQSQNDLELRAAFIKIKELEKIKLDLEDEIAVLKKEKCSLKGSLAMVEKEKDGLLIALDEKTEKVAKSESQIKKQELHINELNDQICQLEKKFEFLLNEKTSREHGIRTLERTVERLKEELEKSERVREAIVKENRRLQDDLASAAKDCFTARKELNEEKQSVENLKRQLQQYVSEVKRAEELLSKKESERNQMLDHFRSLSLEATALESNNHTLESAVENTKTQLATASNRVMDLERQVDSKDSLLCGYEKQIAELTSQIAELEARLRHQTEQKVRAEEDLTALRDLCSTIDGQKEVLRRQANSYDAEKVELMNEVRRLSEEYEGLNQKLTHERSLSQTLEKSLTNSRQETLEHKITNKDLQAQVLHLRQKVTELTQKLESESEDVRRYQSQCADLSQQVAELRREVTNARFDQARALESCRRNSPQFFTDDSEVEATEIRFEEKSRKDSHRNVPPLTFPEDSDQTVSLDSDKDYSEFHFERSPKRLHSGLSPLMEERVEEKSESGIPTDAASELSSLPEDSVPKVKYHDASCKELTPHPTFSVRERLQSETEAVNLRSGENIEMCSCRSDLIDWRRDRVLALLSAGTCFSENAFDTPDCSLEMDLKRNNEGTRQGSFYEEHSGRLLESFSTLNQETICGRVIGNFSEDNSNVDFRKPDIDEKTFTL